VDGRTSPRPPRLYTQVPAPVGWISSEIYARRAEELPRFCCWEIAALARKTESDRAMPAHRAPLIGESARQTRGPRVVGTARAESDSRWRGYETGTAKKGEGIEMRGRSHL
jgi:hypothetical protein